MITLSGGEIEGMFSEGIFGGEHKTPVFSCISRKGGDVSDHAYLTVQIHAKQYTI